MLNESDKKIGEVSKACSDGAPLISRRRMLLVLATLGLSACDLKKNEASAPDAAPEDFAEVGFQEFLKPEQRGSFVREFAKEMKLKKPYSGFDLPAGYLWKLDQSMIGAGKANGVEGVPSCQEFWDTEQGVLASVLSRLLGEWRHLDLKHSGPNLFSGTYHHELYEHYLILRRMERMPQRPKAAGACDFVVMTEERNLARHEAWQLAGQSPFYGRGEKTTCGPLEAPFCDTMVKLIADMTARMPNKDSKYYNPSDAACVRSSVIDMYLPGMYLGAIRERLKLARLEPGEIGFSEDDFEAELKESYEQRAKAFLKSARIYRHMKLRQRLFNMVGRKFEAFGKMEHPLELFKHD